MRHRVRAAAIIVRGDELLLVHHIDPTSGKSYWVPPGGGLEAEDASVIHCAIRETFEESGLRVILSKVAYVAEFQESPSATLHLEIFFLADSYEGEITLTHLPEDQPDFDIIQETRWVHRDELDSLTVYPEELKSDFWDHLAEGFPTTIYLGRRGTEPT